jgi:hypothetical protein
MCVGAIAFVIGCGSGDGGVVSTGSGSGSAGSGGEATSASTGPMSTNDSSSSASTTAEATTSGADDAPLSEGGDDGPRPDVGSCDFETTVCEIADDGKRPAMDCGFVTFADDIFAWQAAHDCAWAALQSQGAFKVMWQPMTIDSLAYEGLVGVVADSYAITYVSYDDYQGDIHLISWPVEDVGINCKVSVGHMCFDLIGGGDTTVICR